MSGTADRIKALCKARGITVRKFEIDCGFGNGYVRTMAKQDSTPNGKNITTIAHYFDVSEAYLLGEKELQRVATHLCVTTGLHHGLQHVLSNKKRGRTGACPTSQNHTGRVQYRDFVTFTASHSCNNHRCLFL